MISTVHLPGIGKRLISLSLHRLRTGQWKQPFYVAGISDQVLNRLAFARLQVVCWRD